MTLHRLAEPRRRWLARIGLALALGLGAPSARAADAPDASPCPVPAPIDPASVLPLVRSRAWAEEMQARFHAVPMHVLNRELAVVYFANEPKQLRSFSVPAADLGCWDAEETLRVERRHYASVIGSVEFAATKKPGVWMLVLKNGGVFEASLILAPGVVRKAFDGPIGTMIVGVPNRDMLLVADPRDATAVKGLRELVTALHASGDHPLSNALFLLDACRLEVVDDLDAVGRTAGCR